VTFRNVCITLRKSVKAKRLNKDKKNKMSREVMKAIKNEGGALLNTMEPTM